MGRSHFVYLSITLWTFGFLPVLGYCDNVAMKICVRGFAFVLCTSTQVFFILLAHLSVEFLGHLITMFKPFGKCFPKGIPQATVF